MRRKKSNWSLNQYSCFTMPRPRTISSREVPQRQDFDLWWASHLRRREPAIIHPCQRIRRYLIWMHTSQSGAFSYMPPSSLILSSTRKGVYWLLSSITLSAKCRTSQYLNIPGSFLLCIRKPSNFFSSKDWFSIDSSADEGTRLDTPMSQRIMDETRIATHAGPWQTAATYLSPLQNASTSLAQSGSVAKSIPGPCPPIKKTAA